MKERHIYIVLCRSSSILSRIIGYITGDTCTHSAISFDSGLGEMFSFGRKWHRNPFVGCFRTERLDNKLYLRSRRLPGIVTEITVTEEQFDQLNENVKDFIFNGRQYSYNIIGLVFNRLGLVMERKNKFFCSEFVYHLLSESGVCNLGVPRGLVRPVTLLKIESKIIYEGDLLDYYELYAKDGIPLCREKLVR